MIYNTLIYRIAYVVVVMMIIVYSNMNIRIIVTGSKYKRSFFLIVVSALTGLFAAVRPFDIQDTLAYLRVYESVNTPLIYLQDFWRIGVRTKAIETGFVFLMAVCKQLSLDFRLFLFIIAFGNTMITLNAIHQISLTSVYQNDFVFALKPNNDNDDFIRLDQRISMVNIKNEIAVYYSFFAFHYCCIAIRAGLSIGLCLMSVSYLLRNRKLASAIVYFIAIKMHSMSLLFLIVLVYVYFKRGKRMNIKQTKVKIIHICVIICFFSLAFNLGSRLIECIATLIKSITNYYSISGFSGYLSILDKNVGLKDWLTVGVIGTNVLILKYYASDAAVELIIFGLLITSFLYPIRAINRAADYFYCLQMPAFVVFKQKWRSSNRFRYLNSFFLPLLLCVQIAYTV